MDIVFWGFIATQALFGAALYGQGFTGADAGSRIYEKYAPGEISRTTQLNEPLGQQRADAIARALGLEKSKCLNEEQFLAFVTGNGVGGDLDNAFLVDECVFILTNTKENPLLRNIDGTPTPIILGSYGLTVDTNGMLESPANTNCPTREVNPLIIPGGYVDTWCRANGATASVEMLYRSAFTVQSVYGNEAQQEGGTAQLVTNTIGTNISVVGMSMAPPLWEVNFCLIYMLNPRLAANMPAYWAPIPEPVVQALLESTNGQIPYSDYASYLQ